MNNFTTLFNNNFKQYYALPKDKKKRIGKVVGLGVFGLIILAYVAVVCYMLYAFSGTFHNQNILQNLLASIMFVFQVIILFYGTTSMMSVVFFAKDNEFLQSLPVRQSEIFLSKLSVVYVSNLALSAIGLIPIFIVAGISAGMSWFYYLLIIPAVFFTPMIPLLIVSLIALPILYLTKLFKRNNIVSLISLIVLIATVFGLYFGLVFSASSQFGETTNPDGVIALFAGTLKTISVIIYPNLMIGKAMVGISVIGNTIGYIAITIGALALALGVSLLLYKKISVGAIQTSVTAKKKAHVKTNSKSHSVIGTLIINDLRNVFRNTQLAISSLMGLIIAPIMLVIMSLSMKGYSGGMAILTLPLYLFCCAMNYFAMIAVSREGMSLHIIKTMPITSRQYLWSKMIIANLYSYITIGLVAIVYFSINKYVMDDIFIILELILFATALNAFSLLRDFKSPKLNWISINQILKNRMSSLIPMLITLVIGFVATISKGFLSVYIYHTIFVGAGLISCIVMNVLLFKNAGKYYDAIE